MQTGRTTQAAAPARFRNVTVGVGYREISAEREAMAERPRTLERRADRGPRRLRRQRADAFHARHLEPKRRTDDDRFSVRAIVDGRTGVATANAPTMRRSTVAPRALEMANVRAERSADVATLPAGGRRTRRRERTSTRQRRATRRHEHAICDAIFAQAEAARLLVRRAMRRPRASGMTIANTSGALASFDGTDAAVNVKVTAADSTGFAEHYTADIGAIDGRVGARAVEIARRARSARRRAGRVDGDLRAAGLRRTADLSRSRTSRRRFQRRLVVFSRRARSHVLRRTLTIADDYAIRSPGDAVRLRRAAEDASAAGRTGVVRNIVTDSYYAKKLGRPNTGHALPAPNAYGPQPLNVVVAPGTKSSRN